LSIHSRSWVLRPTLSTRDFEFSLEINVFSRRGGSRISHDIFRALADAAFAGIGTADGEVAATRQLTKTADSQKQKSGQKCR
jgi:hypothetical protein